MADEDEGKVYVVNGVGEGLESAPTVAESEDEKAEPQPMMLLNCPGVRTPIGAVGCKAALCMDARLTGLQMLDVMRTQGWDCIVTQTTERNVAAPHCPACLATVTRIIQNRQAAAARMVKVSS